MKAYSYNSSPYHFYEISHKLFLYGPKSILNLVLKHVYAKTSLTLKFPLTTINAVAKTRYLINAFKNKQILNGVYFWLFK